MSNTVEIFFDNYDGCCYPGQTIAGRVECYFNKQKNLRAIRIKFKGRAETQWTESRSHYNSTTKKNETRRVTYSACEYYFNAEYNLVQGGENFSLPPGRHSYPFSYILPQVLPSSFEGDYGNIRYSVKATVDRPWKFDYEAYSSLKVFSPLDLNYVPRVREPIGVSVDKNLCCCWCQSGPLTFEISLPATGYASGQEVNIGAYIQNMSNVSVECVKFKVIKELEFIAHHPSTSRRYEENVVTACRDGGIGAHGEKSWTSVLVIPQDMNFPNLNGCGIINVTYTLKAKAVLPCPHSNLDTSFPFTIGNIPLSGINTTIPGPPPPNEFPLPNYNSVAPLPQINSYPPQPGATAPPPEAAPLLPGLAAPYPGGDAKYPPGMGAPYPPEVPSAPGGAPYPPANGIATGGAPYPPEKAPYPPEKVPGETSGAPYPSGGVPFPPSSASAPYPPPSGSAPYLPSSGSAPYPPPSGSAPYPPSSGSAPYSPSSGSAPYPPSSGSAPYPPSSAGAPYPPAGGSDIAFAPPSYEEAKKMDEKS